MKDEIILYRDMCYREEVQTLQRGMNYRLNPAYSVILMSQRKDAPYVDHTGDDGFSIEYQGHDHPHDSTCPEPKTVDQPRQTMTGRLTQNGLFAQAVDETRAGEREPEVVRAYEKILRGIWSEKGFFTLSDYRYEPDETGRRVFTFILEEIELDLIDDHLSAAPLRPRTRIIPSWVKKEVWARDKGRCIICGATDELHFDHDVPYSKGGSSITPDNVRLLCARHNLQKSNKIE